MTVGTTSQNKPAWKKKKGLCFGMAESKLSLWHDLKITVQSSAPSHVGDLAFCKVGLSQTELKKDANAENTLLKN